MHVVSRVRADLRARIAHPSVCSTSTDDARDGLLLVFEELASNALRHGGGAVRALVVAGTDGWLLDLSDEAPDRPPVPAVDRDPALGGMGLDRKSTRLNSSHANISYAVFCLKKKTRTRPC